jgi:hypothetical protein
MYIQELFVPETESHASDAAWQMLECNTPYKTYPMKKACWFNPGKLFHLMQTAGVSPDR